MYTGDGEILISTAIEVVNESVALCHETGAICEAYAKDQIIAATVCVSRGDAGRFHILAPCGVCQERLWYWGGDIEVAVPLDHDTTKWRAVALREMNLYYWRKPFMKRG
jgi:cytidine deaminase